MMAHELEAALDSGGPVHVLGVDAAKSSAAALFFVMPGECGPLLRATRGGRAYGIYLRAVWSFSLGEEWQIAGSVLAGCPLQGAPLLVAWEAQYLGKNPRSMAAIVAARARFLFAVELRARLHETALYQSAVNPSSWQATVLGPSRGRERDGIKAAAEGLAPQIAACCGNRHILPQGDAADATCIGLHEIARHFTVDIAAIRGESGVAPVRRRG